MFYYIGTDSIGLCVIFVGTDSVAIYVVLHRYRFYGPVRYIRRYGFCSPIVVLHRYRFYGPVRYIRRYGFCSPICCMQPAALHVTFNLA